MANDNSSLPLLLSITGAVVTVAIGGWFYLDQDNAAPAASPPQPAVTAEESQPADEPAEPSVNQSESTAAVSTTSPSTVDLNLRRAQLAAGSDMLVLPEDSSALYYYGLVLAEEPDNAIARAERNSVLSDVGQVVTAHLAAEEYADAYEISERVARQVPNHALVVETQAFLDEKASALVDEAIQLAREGADSEAAELLAAAEALPGRNADYFVAVRESITEMRDVRVAAEEERLRRTKLADDQAKEAWIEQVRGAIAYGNLIFPDGASAAAFLAESNDWNAERGELVAELRAALVDQTNASIASGRLEDAEAMLEYLQTMEGDAGDLESLRAALENAFVDIQSQRVLQMSDLTRVAMVPPKYPKHALERELSGWVDIYFTVTPQGNTTDIEVSSWAPSNIFNKAAVRAVEKWEFEPVQYRGQLISQRVATRLTFELN